LKVATLRSKAARFAVACLAIGCVPDFVDDTSLVGEARVVAVQSQPAEAAEGEAVTLRALVVAADRSAEPELAWSLCLARKPLSELGPVSPECLISPQAEPEVRASLGRGAEAEALLPEDACQRFGPQRPDPKPGEPAGRPVDPDPTGGFYQPVVAWLADTAALGAARLTCQIRDTTFTRRYKRNRNPELTAFDVLRADGSVLESSADEPITLRRGEAVNLRVRWPVCPASDSCGDEICGIDEDAVTCAEDCSEPRGCAGAERYALFDPLALTTSAAVESLVVAWFATAGRFDAPRTDRVAAAGSDGEPGTLNRYVAPSSGAVTLWAVVRDDRGGVSWLERSVVLTE
jgi:hypothetical protein